MTDLSKIASLSGQGGLFRIHSPIKNGVVLESLDERKLKLVAGPSSKVSVLSEISIYTTSADGAVPLSGVLEAIYDRYKDKLTVTGKSEPADLKKLLIEVLPDADLDRVYASDIKKLVTWYHILVREVPEIWKKEEPVKEEKPKTERKKAEKEDSGEKPEKPKKPKAAPKKG